MSAAARSSTPSGAAAVIAPGRRATEPANADAHDVVYAGEDELGVGAARARRYTSEVDDDLPPVADSKPAITSTINSR